MTNRIAITLMFGLLAACSREVPQNPAIQEAIDRLEIRELMDLYGTVHDIGTPEEYADLFTEDGEIGSGGRVMVKGREALMAQAVRDHERYTETDARGRTSSIMRHLITNAQVKITGENTAEGTCYVTTMVRKGDVGPAVLSISRYIDQYVKVDGKWRIQHRDILLEYGNNELAGLMGFR
jgi:hypothetical protein